jgi:hypothetical protein
MFRLSGHIRRQLGKKVLELKGNAVIGFKQYFDLESEKRAITARAIGTAVRLAPHYGDGGYASDLMGVLSVSPMLPAHTPSLMAMESIPISPALVGNTQLTKYSKSPTGDWPLANSPSSSAKDLYLPSAYKSMDNVTLITLSTFPAGTILGTGGLVSATSIKLIDNDERAIREAWWTELREEIKSHAKALCCPFIIGYSEYTSIHEELAILHCSGTAAYLDIYEMVGSAPFSHGSRLPSTDLILEKDLNEANVLKPTATGGEDLSSHNAVEEQGDISEGVAHRLQTLNRKQSHHSLIEGTELFTRKRRKRKKKRYPACQCCHITYPKYESPFPMALSKCLLCKKHSVPEILLTTVEPPTELKTISEGRLIEAHGKSVIYNYLKVFFTLFKNICSMSTKQNKSGRHTSQLCL